MKVKKYFVITNDYLKQIKELVNSITPMSFISCELENITRSYGECGILKTESTCECKLTINFVRPKDDSRIKNWENKR